MISAFRSKFSTVLPLFTSTSLKSLTTKSSAYYASNKEIAKAANEREELNSKSYQSLKDNNWLVYDPKHKRSASTHKSVAEQFIHRIPVIYVDSNIVRCMGGTKPGAGHPQVYIQLNTRDPTKSVPCAYCGLRFQKNPGHETHGDYDGHH